MIRDIQLSHTTVAVPPGWKLDKKSSGDRETAAIEYDHVWCNADLNKAICSGRFQFTLVSGKFTIAAPYCLQSFKSCRSEIAL
jgi:hypothetical protein